MAISNEFYLRRLHSLTGVLMGLFLFNHFLTNSFIFFGRESFNHKVHLIHSIPGLLLLEIALVAAPFIFHGAYGLYIMMNGKQNFQYYRYTRNSLYTIQRLTAAILTAFILWHVLELRFYVSMLVDHYTKESHEFVLGAKFYDYLVIKFESPLFVLGYVVGVASAIVHWANGICTFCMSWGITVGPRSQKMMAGFAVGVALLYTLMIGAGIFGLIFPPDAAEPILELNLYPTNWEPQIISAVTPFAPGQLL
jgi:succinate dehydrogenase / fumarate reductase cytochrome b subunit